MILITNKPPGGRSVPPLAPRSLSLPLRLRIPNARPHLDRTHKERKPKGTTWPDFVAKHFSFGRRRADELIQIAGGTTTVAEVRQLKRESVKKVSECSLWYTTESRLDEGALFSPTPEWCSARRVKVLLGSTAGTLSHQRAVIATRGKDGGRRHLETAQP